MAGGVDNHATRTSSFLITQPYVIKHRRCLLHPVEKNCKDASDLTVACTTLSDRNRIRRRLGSVQTYDYIHISGGIFVARARTECGFEPRRAPWFSTPATRNFAGRPFATTPYVSSKKKGRARIPLATALHPYIRHRTGLTMRHSQCFLPSMVADIWSGYRLSPRATALLRMRRVMPKPNLIDRRRTVL